MPSRIALVTDFGSNGPYTGQVRLLLQGLSPATPVIELMSDLAPFRPDLAAYLLPRLTEGMPDDTLYLCVVDPGVGGSRGALVLQADNNWYLGPDNGLLSQVARCARSVRCRRIDWKPEKLSDSFHGRDLFAPVAARIVSGKGVSGVSMEADELVGRDWLSQAHCVIYKDGYGNLCTGVDGKSVADAKRVSAGGMFLPYARTFSSIGTGEAFWYRNSFGLVELAVNCGRADEMLGLKPGDSVTVE